MKMKTIGLTLLSFLAFGCSEFEEGKTANDANMKYAIDTYVEAGVTNEKPVFFWFDSEQKYLRIYKSDRRYVTREEMLEELDNNPSPLF